MEKRSGLSNNPTAANQVRANGSPLELAATPAVHDDDDVISQTIAIFLQRSQSIVLLAAWVNYFLKTKSRRPRGAKPLLPRQYGGHKPRSPHLSF